MKRARREARPSSFVKGNQPFRTTFGASFTSVVAHPAAKLARRTAAVMLRAIFFIGIILVESLRDLQTSRI